MRSVREAVSSFRRAPLLSGLSCLSIGFSLLILGLFGLAAHNIDLALSSVEARFEVVGYLPDGVSQDQLDLARKEISSYPEVQEVRYISKVEALHDASKELTEFSDVFSNLDVNPLPASLEVRLKSGFRNPRDIAAVADRMKGYPFLNDVRYGADWVRRIYALRRIGAGAATVLGGAFALVAIMLIGTAVRMAILARAREISIMQIVGATPGYIQRPFLVEGLVTGLAGGVMALLLTRGLYLLVDHGLFRLAWLPDSWVLLGTLAGGILGMLAAWRAVRREIRSLEPYGA